MLNACRKTVVMGLGPGLLLAAVLMATGCASTPGPMPAATGRLEALNGLAQVNATTRNATAPTVVIYHSPRCGFCSGMLKGIRRNLSDFGPKAVIYTVDIDSNTDVRDSKGIGPVPVTVFYQNGREVNRWRTYRPGFVVRRRFRQFFGG